MGRIFGYDIIVAFDLETTGLDPSVDKIIEIGAVKLYPDGTTEEFSTLVNPEIPIPFRVRQLTGIDNNMVLGAPPAKKAVADFLDFIGGDDVLLAAHNASFDVGFINVSLLDAGKEPLRNPVVDTLSLARILYPDLLNHQLETVAGLFKFDLRQAHRATEDARACLEVAVGLWKTLLALPEEVFDKIYAILQQSNMPGILDLWEAAAQDRILSRYEPPEIDEKYLLRLSNEFGEKEKGTVEFSPEVVLEYFSEDSPLRAVMPEYRFRPQQRQMAELVLSALINGEVALIEAGTGIGKSFAYLIPMLFWAVSNGERVVVSTFTKALEEQLFFSDLEVLRRALPFDFKAVLLKGKGNYICLRRVERYLKNPQLLTYNERKALLYIIPWLARTKSGDISENTAFSNSGSRHLWEKIRAESITCIGSKCPFFKRGCYVYSIRRKVRDAQVVVVNHSLLLADAAGGVLGDYNYIVLDEAHNLERVAADTYGAIVARWRIVSALDSIFTDVPRPSGTLAFLFSSLRNREKYGELYQQCINAIMSARSMTFTFFMELTEQMELVYHWREQRYPVRKRYDPDNPVFRKISKFGAQLIEHLKQVKLTLERFVESVVPEDEESERLTEELRGEIERIDSIMDALITSLNPTESDLVYWMESPSPQDGNENAAASLNFAYLDIGRILDSVIYRKVATAVLTSATLSIAGDFSYYIKALGLYRLTPKRLVTAILGSPYDYDRQLKVFVGRFLPPPSPHNEREFTDEIVRVIWEVSRRFRAGALALFTSHHMLQNVFYELHSLLEEEGITLLAQQLSGSQAAVRRRFIEEVESVLLGTESFWQGVNVPGESLEVLFIVKLPFGVPDEPYSEAKQEEIRACGGNPFIEYVVPQSVIRFRQGVGRLIRSESDRGVLIILDPRISTKRYGKMFVDSLPTRAIDVFSIDELLMKMEEHFGDKR